MQAKAAPKIGLVLTGGGAKGAYHVGAIQAISEMNIPIHAVAGASIGALNGAIVATASDTQQAYVNLRKIWDELANDKVISLSGSLPIYIGIMASMGTAFKVGSTVTPGVKLASRIAKYLGLSVPDINAELLDSSYLVQLLERCISSQAIRSGLPMYVSAYQSEGGMADILGVLQASLRLGNTRESEYFHLQEMSDPMIQEALLGSAALPLLFKSRHIDNQSYTDGGQGDWYGAGGNTPVEPLAKAGYDTIIVVHLCDGSMWDRSRYPNTNIIEIRPGGSIARGNAAADLLGFDHNRINSWIDQGYQDSRHTLQRVLKILSISDELSSSGMELAKSIERLSAPDEKLASAMKRLR